MKNKVKLTKNADIRVLKSQYINLINELQINDCWVTETQNDDGYNQVDNDKNALEIIIANCDLSEEDIEILKNKNIDSFIIIKD